MGIVLKNISYQYKEQWQEEKQYALRDVSFSLEKGEYAALALHVLTALGVPWSGIVRILL